MDPFGIFALPRLCLQEFFHELLRMAVKDPFWRSEAWKLLLASLGEDIKDGYLSESEVIDCGAFRRGSPTHAELYWILVAMMRHGVGAEVAKDLEPWAPLLSLVVTQLAFGPRMVSAMMERDEQHIRHNRFAELVTAVVEGFAKYGSANKGTVLLLNYRCSSAVFQSKDDKESAVIRALVELCLRLRAERHAPGEDRAYRPLLLCLVSREGTLQDDNTIAAAAKECGSLVCVDDLDDDAAADFVRHGLQNLRTHDSRPTFGSAFSAAASRRNSAIVSVAASRRNSGIPALSVEAARRRQSQSLTPRPEAGALAPHAVISQAAGRLEASRSPSEASQQDMDVLAEYVFEVTGGNPLGVLTLLQELDRQEVLVSSPANRTILTLTSACPNVEWLRSKVQPPQSLVAMAFSVFERLDPKQQMVLKAASTITGDFSLVELKAALEEISLEELHGICVRLSEPSSHTLRRVVTDEVVRPRRPSVNAGSLKKSASGIRETRRESHSTATRDSQSQPQHRFHHNRDSQSNHLSIGRQGTAKLERRRSRVMEERFKFYSTIMRHVATTLVLETQRTELLKRTTSAADYLTEEDFFFQGSSTDEELQSEEDSDEADEEEPD
jgi:hypothetical protein